MLDHRLLQAFVTVARTGSMSRAAAELGYSQPAVSMQVQRIEQLLGTQLLVRDPGRLRLTPAGRQCFALAEVILLLGERLVDPVPESPTGAASRPLPVGAGPRRSGR